MSDASLLVPGPDDVALAPLVDAARSYLDAAQAPRTRAAYGAQWRHFTSWCRAHGLTSLPAAPGTVALYLSARAREGRKVATLAQALSAINQAHQLSAHPLPGASASVRETFKGIRRTHGVAPAQKAPLALDQLRAMMRTLDDAPSPIIAARDRAILLVGFAGAFRRSELVALHLDDVRRSPDGLIITLRRSKTDQEGRGRSIGIPNGRAPATCPVRSVERWLAAAQLDEGVLFRSVDRHGRIGGALSGRDVARIVQRRAAAAGLDPHAFAAHSLRAGLATAAAQAGKSVQAIMKTTGHRSVAMVHKYIREAELFRDNAVDGLL